MSKFKKLLTAFMATSLLLVGCNNKEEVKKEEPKVEQKNEDKYSYTVLVREDPATTSELTFYYEGDTVKVQTAKNIVNYKALGKTKEQVKQILDPISKNLQNIKGVNQKIEFGDNEAVEELSVNYDEVDIKELRKAQGTQFSGDENATTVSYSKTIESIQKAGFKIKEEKKK